MYGYYKLFYELHEAMFSLFFFSFFISSYCMYAGHLNWLKHLQTKGGTGLEEASSCRGQSTTHYRTSRYDNSTTADQRTGSSTLIRANA